MAEKKPKRTREELAALRREAALRNKAFTANRARSNLEIAAEGDRIANRDAINRQRLRFTAPYNTRAAQARPLPQVRGTPPTNPADMTAAQRFAANPAGGIQPRVRGAPASLPRSASAPVPPTPPAGPTLGRRALRMAGPAGLFAEGMLHSPEAQAPTNYPLEEQETFGMPQEDFIAQLAAAGIADPQRTAGMLMQPENPGSFNPVLNAALAYRYDPAELDLEGAFERSSAEDFLPEQAEQFTPEGGMSPFEFGQDYLNPAGMSAYEFGQEYLNPLLTSPAVGYRALQEGPGRGIADLLRGAAGYERLPEEQELIEAVDRPDLAQQQIATPGPVPEQSITRTPADPYEQRQRALIEEYMMGQQQGDPRQRRIMGSANEFAANRPEPRMSQQQLEAALMQLAREESMQATDPFAGYDESLFPEGSQVFVDPVTGATSFEGNQDYIPDAALTGRQSMDDLRLGTEYTSRALRNVGRARGVPSPQEVERKRMLSTLGGEAQGQGYRADELADQMRRVRSGLNSQNLTPQELAVGQAQLSSLGAELAAARGGAEQARALQLQGSMQPVPPAPEDFELQQLQEAETARTQAQAVADQRRLLKELDIESRGRVDARDMQQYTEMFSELEPSVLPPGMSMANADPEMQEAERARLNRIQLATTLASSQKGFRTQPALAMEAARLLSTLRDDPKTQSAFMRVLLEASPEELSQLLQELYDDVGGL